MEAIPDLANSLWGLFNELGNVYDIAQWLLGGIYALVRYSAPV